MNRGCDFQPKRVVIAGRGAACVLAGIMVVSAGSGAMGASGESEAHAAVLDFTMEAVSTGGPDWSVGAADLMEVELAKRGVHLLERRQIRLVLGERRNYRSGILSDSLKVEGLPRPRTFVTGTFSRTGEKRFRLQAKLVSVRDGVDLSSFTVEGVYPAQWLDALSSAADKFVQVIPGLKPEPARKEVLPGVSRKPEAASAFYRGIAYYTEGNLEEAFRCFHQARLTDPGFYLAEAWYMRTLDACGFPEHAAVVREDLRQHSGGALVAGMTVASHLKSKGNSVWILNADDGVPHDWMLALKQGLQKNAHIFFFDPARVGDLAREADLQLTGELIAAETPDVASWMGADTLLRIRRKEDVLALSLHDFATGQMLTSLEASARTLPTSGLLSNLVVSTAGGATGLNSTNASIPSAAPASGTGSEFWAYRCNPTDPRALFRVRICFLEMGIQENGKQCVVLVDKIARLMESPKWEKSPERPFWELLIRLYRADAEAQVHWTPGRLCPITTPLRELLKPIIDRYPSSLPANMARYAVAQELKQAGKHQESAELLRKVREDLANLADSNVIATNAIGGYRDNVALALATELAACGKNKDALDAITGERKVTSGGLRLFAVPFADPGSIGETWRVDCFTWRANGLVRFRPDLSLSVTTETEKLRKRLQTSIGTGTNPTFGTTTLLGMAQKAQGREAAAYFLKYLQQSLEEMKPNERPSRAFFSSLAWLNLDRLSPEDRLAASNFVVRATARLPASRDKYFLLAAAGQPESASPHIREWIKNAAYEEKIEAINEGAVFQSMVYAPAASRAFVKRAMNEWFRSPEVKTAAQRFSADWRLGEYSVVIRKCVLPDEYESYCRKIMFASKPDIRRFWMCEAAYLRGDILKATEDCRKLIETPEANDPNAALQAPRLLAHLRTYGTFFDDVALSIPAAPPPDARAAARALSLHVEVCHDAYWWNQARRHFKETGTNAVAVWIRLLQQPMSTRCACGGFVTLLENPPHGDRAAVVQCLERLIVSWDDFEGQGLSLSAAVALGNMGNAAGDAVPFLIASTSQDATWVGKNARWALDKIGQAPPRCAPRLAALLKHPDSRVRILSARTLLGLQNMPREIGQNVGDADLPGVLEKWWESDASQDFKAKGGAGDRGQGASSSGSAAAVETDPWARDDAVIKGEGK